MPPRCGCRLAVADKAFLHNAQFIIIWPMPAAITVSGGKNFDLRAVDKVGHKVGLTIGSIPKSDGRRRRLTAVTAQAMTNRAQGPRSCPGITEIPVRDLPIRVSGNY